MRFNTGNPINSLAEEDFYDNCLSLDQAMNSTEPTWRDRFNVEKPTIDAALKSAGFMPAGFDFVTGGTLQPGDRNKAVFNPAPNGDNNWYRWNGVFPKVITANSQPEPKNETGWSPVNIRTGVVEREALRRTYLEAGLNLVPGSFGVGGVLASVSDTLLDEATGKVYSWNGSFPKVVPAGSTVAGFIDKSDALCLFFIPANGVPANGDATEVINIFLNSSQTNKKKIIIDLGCNEYSINDVNVPPGLDVTFRNGGILSTNRGVGRETTISPQSGGKSADFPVKFENIHFKKVTTSGSCAYINLAWQDSTAGLYFSPTCKFTLMNGAVGIHLKRSFFNNINGSFTMDGNSKGILLDGTDSTQHAPGSVFETSLDVCDFTGGIGIDCLYNETYWNSFEGLSLSGNCRFYGSRLYFKKYNTLKILGTHLVSSMPVFDGGYSTTLSGFYADRNTADQGPIITISSISRGVYGFTASGLINAQGSKGTILLITDKNSPPGHLMNDVVLDNLQFIGGLIGDGVTGVELDHEKLNQFKLSSTCFFGALCTCVKFTKPIARSVIERFLFKDIVKYSEDADKGYNTRYNDFSVYKEFDIELLIPTYVATSVAETVLTIPFPVGSMMRPPTGSMKNIDSFFGEGLFTIISTNASQGLIPLQLVKNPGAPGNTRGGCKGTLVLDAQTYIAPL